jgi:beta-lactamase regulating signal transducer with metallopeptidase domain
MSDFVYSMALLAIQISAVAIVALLLDAWLARRSPSAAARLLFAAILALPVLTVVIFCPLPNWWNWQGETKPMACDARTIDADQSGETSASKAEPASSSKSEGGMSLSRFLQLLPVTRTHWQPSPQVGQLLALAWMFGIAVCAMRLLGGIWLVGRLRQRSELIHDQDCRNLLRQMSMKMGLPDKIELREATLPGLPATVGWAKPIILLPLDWRTWGDVELRSALAHELAHIFAQDFLSGVIAQLASAVHFYHPLTSRLMNRLRLRREMAADLLAARQVGGRREYIRALARLALCREQAGTGVPSPLLLSAHGGVLIRRIQMLRNTEEARPQSRTVRGLALAILAGSALFASAMRLPAGMPDAESTESAAAASDVEPFDLSYLSANPEAVHAVVCLRPSVLLAQPGMAEYAKQQHKTIEAMLRSMGRSLPDGISVADIDQIVLDATFSVNTKAPPPNRSVMCGSGHLMIRMHKDVDWRKLLSSLFGKVKTTKQDVYTIYSVKAPALGPQELSVCAMDSRTLIAVQEKDGKFLVPVKGAKSNIVLGSSWSKVERSPIAICFDNHDGYFTKSLSPEVPDVTGLANLINASESVCLEVSFRPGMASRVFIQGKSESQAKEIVASIDRLAKLTKSEMAAKPKDGEKTSDDEAEQKLATEFLQSGKVEIEGTQVMAEGHSTVRLAEFLTGLSGNAHVGEEKSK